MNYKYSLSINQQKQMFLFGYYNRPFFWFQRRFSGPFLVAIAIWYFMTSAVDFYPLSVVFLLTGIIFIIRPFIFLKRLKFSDKKAQIKIQEQEILIIDERGDLRIKKENLLQIISKKNYLFLKLKFEMIQYYLIDLAALDNKADDFLQDLHNFYSSKNKI